jgi:hypothetical protein
MILVGLPIFAFWEEKKKKKRGGKGKGKKKRLQTVLLLPSARARKTSPFTHPKTTGMATTKDLKSKGGGKKKKSRARRGLLYKKGDWQASIPKGDSLPNGHARGWTYIHKVTLSVCMGWGGFFFLSLSFLS